MTRGEAGIQLSIDGVAVECAPAETILDAARRAGLAAHIPALCHRAGSVPEGGCRLCLVEIEGHARPSAACHTAAEAGQVVITTGARLDGWRRGILELWTDAVPATTAFPVAGGGQRQRFRQLLDSLDIAPMAPLPGITQIPVSHPYLRFDPDRCLVCRRCVSACADQQGQFVFAIQDRGAATRLGFGTGQEFSGSACVGCGACVEACPTGALFDADRSGPPPATMQYTATVCGYCGVGCRIDVGTCQGAVVQITGHEAAAVNRGHLCAKGRYAHAFLASPDRLTQPLLREAGGWRPLGWPEAVQWLARRILEIKRAHGADALGVMTSSRSTNEAAYLLQKLFRGVIGTNNVDCCARVCHSSTALALQLMTGTGAATASYDDIERARVIVLAGANPTEAHPVLGARIKQAVRRGARLIVVDPRVTELAEWADLHLPLRAGTNVALFNALAQVLVEEDRVDHAYLSARTEGLAELKELLAATSVEKAAEVCALPADAIREAARLVGGAGACLFVTGLGLSELTQGTASVMALTNVALLTGSIGRPGAGLLPLRGQNNVQGNADMGAMPGQITGYQSLDDPAVCRRVLDLWGAELRAEPGLTIPEMLEAALAGGIRGLWIQGEDVAQSDPNEQRVRAALAGLDLLVVQELFLSETARYAHLVLPAAGALEQDGTFTNAERRIQRVRRTVPPPGEALADWEVVQRVAGALGAPWHYGHPGQVMDEVARIAPALFGGVSYHRLEGDGLQWPCPDPGHPGTPLVHADGFVGGRGRLMAVAYEPTPEAVSPEFPCLLITGRVLQHYNVGTMTRRTPNRELADRDWLEIHPRDAVAASIGDGSWVQVESRYGHTRVRARVTRRVAPGTLFLSFHFPETHANALTSGHGDPRSRCPEYKVTAVRIRAAGDGGAAAPPPA